MKFSGVIYIFALLFQSLSSFGQAEQIPAAKEGVLDLRGLSEMPEVVKLNGEWTFYWETFISPDDKESSSHIYVKVPSYWTQYDNQIPSVEGFGYGSYRLKILLPENQYDDLSLKVPIFDSSFELFVNGKRLGGNGQVGSSAESSEPAYAPFICDIKPESGQVDIVIHVSNFDHRRGGFWKTMLLGQKEKMEFKNERSKIIMYALIGILFGAFLLFMVFYAVERKTISFLYFSLTSLGMLLRLMNINFFPAEFFFEKSWIWLIRTEYLGTFITYIFGTLFLNKTFPKAGLHKLVKINTWVFSALALSILFLKVPTFSYLILLLELGAVLLLSYYIVYSFIGILKRQLFESIFFFSVLAFLLSIIYDSFVSLSLFGISTNYLSPIGFFLLIAGQAIILVVKWLKTYKEIDSLHSELENINKNLENIIEKRTRELNESNADLQQSLDFKNKMFSIIAHDLKSPVSTLAQYSDLLLKRYEKENDNQLLFDIRLMAYSSVDLIENLLYWGMSQGKNIQYRPELVNLKEMADTLLVLYRQALNHKKISCELDIDADIIVFADSSLLKIVSRNLLTNAIKFTPEGGSIKISASKENDLYKIEISDSGIGMDEVKVQHLLNSTAESTAGTEGEKGTGLGMIVVKELISINKGSFFLESKPGRGTSASFTLPGKP